MNKTKKHVYLNSGSYGCVFRPSFDCNDDANTEKRKNDVSKIFINKEAALTEVKEHKKIVSKVDKKNEFTVELITACSINKNKLSSDDLKHCRNMMQINEKKGVLEPIPYDKIDNTLYQLVYKFGGYQLFDAVNIVGFNELFENMGPIFKGLIKLKESKCIHFDIKPLNIVYNPDNKKMSLIDFGKSLIGDQSEHVYTLEHIHDFEYDYPYFPPEFRAVAYQLEKSIRDSNDSITKYIFKNWLQTFRHVQLDIKKFLHNDKLFLTVSTFVQDTLQFNLDFLAKTLKYTYYEDFKYYIDVFSLGVTIFELFVLDYNNGKIIIDDNNVDYYVDIILLVRWMTFPLCYNRFSPEKAYNEYIRILKEHKNINISYKSPYKSPKKSPKKSPEKLPEKTIHDIIDKKENIKRKRTVEKKSKSISCGEDEEISVKSNKCIKKCKENQIRNPLTNRCKNTPKK